MRTLILAAACAMFAAAAAHAGSNCCVSNGGLGCDDPACQAAVCSADPFCCDVAWDGICANQAATLCGSLCSGPPAQNCPTLERLYLGPSGPVNAAGGNVLLTANFGEAFVAHFAGGGSSMQGGILSAMTPLGEGETCLGNGAIDTTNGGCNSDPPVYIDAGCGNRWLGTLSTYIANARTSRDTDWYRVTLTAQDDDDGDGFAELTATLTSQFPTVVAIFSGIESCTVKTQAFAFSANGVAGTAGISLSVPGDYAVFVSTGDANGGIFSGLPCATSLDRRYLLELACSSGCPCSGDLFPPGGDGVVGPGDLAQLLSQWGQCAQCASDLFPAGSPDGVVGPGDLGQLLALWGSCP